MTRGGAWSRVFATALLVAGCSKSEAPKEMVSTSPRIVPGLGVPPPGAALDPNAVAPVPDPTPVPHHDPIEYDGAPLTYTVSETIEAGSAPVVDPEQAIVQAARVSASTCFLGVQGGPDVQSATLQVSVVPSGQVSRTTVSAQTSSREVLDCLRRVGDGLHFTTQADSKSEGIRSFSIDVTVARPH